MDVPNGILLDGAARFGVNPATLRHLGGMDGAVYECLRGKQAFVLKFAPTSMDHMATLRAKLDFVSYLALNGVSVAKPVLSNGGCLIESLNAGEALYALTCTEKAPGCKAQDSGEWGVAQGIELFETWGRVIGQMHRLTKRYDEVRDWPDGLIGGWEQEHAFFAQWCKDDAVREKWLALGDQLRALPRDGDCFGLIHNDLHPHNFFVSRTAQGELRLTLFDFDVCNYHFFMTDIGIALFHALGGRRAPGQSDDDFAAHFMEHFVRGYCRENSLDMVWWRRLPMFLKYRQMLLYTVFSNESNTPNGWQAQWLNKSRRCIVNDMPVVNLTWPQPDGYSS